jgi:hypothetical protein
LRELRCERDKRRREGRIQKYKRGNIGERRKGQKYMKVIKERKECKRLRYERNHSPLNFNRFLYYYSYNTAYICH